MKKIIMQALVLAGAVMLTSCCSSKLKYEDRAFKPRVNVKAIYVADGITLDGKLDEEVWKTAPKYQMKRGISEKIRYAKMITDSYKGDINDPGYVQYAWDDNFLYVAATFVDSDLHDKGETDQIHLYQKGDCFEVFLKPEEDTFYFELYATPLAKKTSYGYTARSLCGLPGSFAEEPVLKKMDVASTYEGTMNDPWDKDKGWKCEMKIPLDEICMRGGPFTQYHWRVFNGRYNYSRYIYGRPELSQFPRQYQVNHHEESDYGYLQFVKIEKP